MLINKYDKNNADIRIKNSLEDYALKNDVGELRKDVQNDRVYFDNKINSLEGKVDEKDKKTNDILERIFLCIKIIFVALILVLLFTVICVLSYFDLKSKMDKELSSSIENIWTVENIV